jgi:glycine/D-amino acid oxidase-like deaminating enzyme
VELDRLVPPRQRLREGARGWKIATPRGTLRAQNVLVATSGYTSRVTPALQKKIIPIGSYIIVTEVLPEKLTAELSPRNRMIYDSKNYLYYYRLTLDRRMLFGGRAAFFPETSSTIRQRRNPSPRHAHRLSPIARR